VAQQGANRTTIHGPATWAARGAAGTVPMTATDAHSRLIRLQAERFEATAAGVPPCSYLARLALAIAGAA